MARTRLPARMRDELLEQLDGLLLVLVDVLKLLLAGDLESRAPPAFLRTAKPRDLALARHDHRVEDRRLLDHGAHGVERELTRPLKPVAVDVDLHVVDPDRLHTALAAAFGWERDYVLLGERLRHGLVFQVTVDVVDDRLDVGRRDQVGQSARHGRLLQLGLSLVSLICWRARIKRDFAGMVTHAARLASRQIRQPKASLF